MGFEATFVCYCAYDFVIFVVGCVCDFLRRFLFWSVLTFCSSRGLAFTLGAVRGRWYGRGAAGAAPGDGSDFNAIASWLCIVAQRVTLGHAKLSHPMLGQPPAGPGTQQ